VKVAGGAGERIEQVRPALTRLDELIAAGGAEQAEFKVKLFDNERTFSSPQEARAGAQAMLLAYFDTISRQYAVTIVTTEVRTLQHGGFWHTKPPQKDDVLVFGLEAVRFLCSFTVEAIRRTGLKNFVLCDEATLNGGRWTPGGAAVQDTIMLEIKNVHPAMGAGLYHELYHVFDQTMLTAQGWAKDAEWLALNPPGQYQGYAAFYGRGAEAQRQAFSQPAPSGFVSVYATASEWEDKAETYSAMMLRSEWLAATIEQDRHIRAKVELIERRLRQLGPEFTPGFWRKSPAPTSVPANPPMAPLAAAPPAAAPAPPTAAPAAAAQPAAAPPGASAIEFVNLPPHKDAGERALLQVGMAAPAQFQLELLGLDEILPKGSVARLEVADPAADVRQWTLLVKAPGALSKEKPLADFRLKAGGLSFQWRLPGSTPPPPPLGYCLLKITGGGDQKICQLIAPADCPPAAVKIGERAPLSIKLPAGACGSATPCQLEVLPQDFPTVQFSGNAALKPGDKTVLKVSGAASGKHPVELELEVEYKLAGPTEAAVSIAAFASTPDTAGKGNNARLREPISLANYERQRKSLLGASKNKESAVKQLAKQIAELERQQTTLTAPGRPQTQLSVQQLAQVRSQLAQAQQERDEADELAQKFAAGHAWYSDMTTLIADLQSKARLGLRVFRPLGGEVVEIARPKAGP